MSRGLKVPVGKADYAGDEEIEDEVLIEPEPQLQESYEKDDGIRCEKVNRVNGA